MAEPLQIDAWDPDRLVALESKVGTQRLTESIQQQITRDAALRGNGDFDRLNGVEWHFFPSDATGRIADDPDLFEALQKANIPYVMHSNRPDAPKPYWVTGEPCSS